MPRSSRKYSATGIYHVMMRGNNRKYIFMEKIDKDKFLEIINTREVGTYKLYAYVIMDNHIHLLIKEDRENISEIIKKMNIKYASYYNKKNRTVGHVFQDRFKSEVVETDKYLFSLLRYIHNNPVKAGIATNLEDYQYSSYIEYINKEKVLNKEEKKELLTLMFGEVLNLEQFKSYHKEIDDNVYMDTPEDMEKLRRTKAQNIIEKFCTEHHYTERKQVMKDGKINELIEQIYIKKQTFLIERLQIVLEIGASTVQRVKTNRPV
ncbi:transposase [Alkalibaculum sp. M08DMB]|uniref:Transposase n=1 Tax=Alkalibaculum sporogenes TaxID=2655001 RepID=A0A6A7K9T8_9FIRM|nr:transposase [Alkalibaculum sporogenes]MPW26125.1 transposase [Alkalibaculum sporogenes]